MGLTVLITGSDGVVRRCAADEPDSAWVPFGITFESALPGGWKGGQFSLRQRIDQDLGLRLLQEVVFIDDDNESVYEGRIVKLPRSQGDDWLIGVECLGWASHMLDDPSVPYFIVDRGVSNWQEPSLARRQAISGSSVSQGLAPATVAEGGITWSVGSVAFPTFDWEELWYAAPPGTKAAKFGYKGKEIGTLTPVETPAAVSASATPTASGTPYTLTLDDTVREATITAPERYLILRTRTQGAAGTPADGAQRSFSKVAVHGNHGLTAVDTPAGSSEPKGYYIDDILVYALNLGAPKLTARSVANGGLIERPPVVVGHATDNDLGTVDRILLDLNKYGLYEWGVFKNREVFYRKTDPDRCCWEARLERGAHLSLEGDDAEHALNGMMVRYTLADGTPRIAGPVGSGLDVESALLGDLDPENTANQMGYRRKWGEQTISFPLPVDDYAVIIGAAYMVQAALPARSGDIELVWECEHPTKGMRPVREVLAGDYIRLSDHPADLPRRIINTNNREDGRANTATVGNDMNKVDAILEQLGVVTTIRVG